MRTLGLALVAVVVTGVYRAAKAMEGSVGVGVTLLRYRELVQALATEVSIANDRAATTLEREMVGHYAAALKAYKDAGTVWEVKLQGADKVTISVNPELKRIARDKDYTISGTGTGDSFTFPLDDAVQSLWQTARRHLAEGHRLYTGEPAKDLPEPH